MRLPRQVEDQSVEQQADRLAAERREQARYRIVGPDELDLRNNQISIDSPLARALVGKELDAEVLVRTPAGEKLWFVVEIEYPPAP